MVVEAEAVVEVVAEVEESDYTDPRRRPIWYARIYPIYLERIGRARQKQRLVSCGPLLIVMVEWQLRKLQPPQGLAG